MLHSVWPLLIESALILLQTVPTHIEIDVLKRKLLEKIDGVLAVHEFHVWQLTGDRIIASAHIRCFDLEEYMRVRSLAQISPLHLHYIMFSAHVLLLLCCRRRKPNRNA